MGKEVEAPSPALTAVANVTMVEGPGGEAAGVSVAYVVQANIPANITISGSVNIRDTRGIPSVVET